MLELSIAPAASQFRSVPGVEDAGVVVWRHVNGELVAYGGHDESGHWMKVAGVGAFEIAPGDVVRAYPDASATQALVEDAFRRTVLPMALQVRGHEVLHASAVVGPSGVVAFCAVSETGKSTVAYGLSRRGHDLWGDDAVAVELSGDGPVSAALDFRVSLRSESVAFFHSRSAGDVITSTGSTHPLAAICVLSRAPVQGAGIRQLPSAEAFSIVLAHAYCFDLEDVERKRKMMETYLQLVEQVATYEVRLPEGLEHLDAALDGIEQQAMAC